MRVQEPTWVWRKRLWVISCVVLTVPCQGYLVVLDVSIEGPWMASDVVTPVCLLCGQAPVEGGGGNMAAREFQKTMREGRIAQGSDALQERKKQHPQIFFF